jgi:predicted transposase/invertase (TIGR01784 family)
MQTDTIFYQLFLTFNSLLFELLGQPPENAIGYEFKSVEVKEKAFRFDGIFMPNSPDKLIYFTEVQFQSNPDFYWEFITEINIYLNQYKPIPDWKGIAIFADRRLEVQMLTRYQQELINSDRIVQIYLDEMTTESIGMALVRLIVSQEDQAPKLVEQIKQRTNIEITDLTLRQNIIELLETVLISKFSKLTRQEIETMFLLDDIKQSRFYQDAKEEGVEVGQKVGLQQGRQEGLEEGRKNEAKVLVSKLLSKRFGKLLDIHIQGISILTLTELEVLVEDLLDFENISDLDRWLANLT